LRGGGGLAVALNAANEVAVARFLDGALSFPGISRVIERTMDAYDGGDVTSLAQVRAVDAWARMHAADLARGLQLKV
jgi:1-deoxy-D-xylulose-5-phosphate reductoisomerase